MHGIYRFLEWRREIVTIDNEKLIAILRTILPEQLVEVRSGRYLNIIQLGGQVNNKSRNEIF